MGAVAEVREGAEERRRRRARVRRVGGSRGGGMARLGGGVEYDRRGGRGAGRAGMLCLVVVLVDGIARFGSRP